MGLNPPPPPANLFPPPKMGQFLSIEKKWPSCSFALIDTRVGFRCEHQIADEHITVLVAHDTSESCGCPSSCNCSDGLDLPGLGQIHGTSVLRRVGASHPHP